MSDSPGKQLRISAPNKETAERAFFEPFGLTLLVCFVGFAALLPYAFLRASTPSTTSTPEQREETRQAHLLERARALAATPLDVASREQPTWPHDDKLAILRYGPRPLAEIVCERALDAPPPKPEEVAPLFAEMARSLDAREEHAPRVCVLAHALGATMPEAAHPTLAPAAERYMTRLEQHESNPRQDAFLVNGLRLSDRLPASPRFLRWLRRCATNPEQAAWRSCVHATSALAPAHGSDLLELIELELIDRADVTTAPPQVADLLRLTSTLSWLAREGSPQEWRPADHPKLMRPDYDLQIASVFALCRWTMSPQRQVAGAAADAIRGVAQTSGLDTDKNLLRVRDTCRVLFGGKFHDVEIASLPIFATNKVPSLPLVERSPDERPDYSFTRLAERGDCTMREGYPLWYCGVTLWKGRATSIADSVKEAYINTRYVNWASPEDLPPVDAFTLRDQMLALDASADAPRVD